MKKVIIIIQFMLSAGYWANAQENTVHLMGRYHQQQVQLRWAPTTYSSWQTGNLKGYQIARIDENGLQMLLPQPLRPLTIEQWATQTDTTNKWNKAAAQLIYGKMNGLPQNPSIAQTKEIGRMQQYAHANALIAADLSAETARGMAMAFTDNAVLPGKTYIYQVWQDGGRDTAWTVVDTQSPYEAPAVTGLVAEEGEHAVTLKWSKKESEPFFTAFWVEKSADKGHTFQRLHQDPLFVSGFAEDGAVNFFIDSLASNYMPMQYRVLGVSAWGETGTPSSVITAQGRDRTPPAGAQHIKATSLAANKIRVSWESVADQKDLAGWIVKRGNDPSGIFTPVNSLPLPPANRTFTDTEPFAFNNNFYQVVAVDTAGNESTSFSAFCYIIDSIAPAVPVGLNGLIDSTGVVAISWDMGKEPDLKGYRVYRSHVPDREYQQMTKAPIFQNYFLDTITLKTLTEKIYYRVVAVDYRFNHSAYSSLLALDKPDLVPPAGAVFKGYQVKKDTIQINWANSTSKDAETLTLYRRLSGSGKWDIAATFSAPFPTVFKDIQLPANARYEYALEVKDDNGLVSGKSAPLGIITRDQEAPLVEGMHADFDQETSTALIQWSYPTEQCRFIVYRSNEAGELVNWKSLEGTARQHKEQVPKGAKYRYAVKALLANGTESPESSVVEVSH